MKKLLLLLFLFTGMVNAQPPINNPTPYLLCDINNDGYGVFNLELKNSEILGALNPSNYTVNYYSSFVDAQININPIPSPNNYINALIYGETIGVRVTDNSTSEFSITTLDLVLNPLPYLPTTIPALYVYENPNDGLAIFDLTLQNNLLSNGDPNVIATYYLTQNDALNEINPILNATAYSGTHLETIWTNVKNSLSGCFAVGSFLLKTTDSALVVYIPDNNFRIKLLSANSSNAIAKDLSGNFTSVDSNSNGEIEFTEALNISYLDVSQSNIADMTGISSFTNLTHLDCRLNLVLNNLDVSNLTSLTYLDAYYAGLVSLNLTPSIVNLDISANSLTGSLDLTTFTNLQTFKSGPYNGLTSLNLSGLTNLISVECSQNSLTTLNVDGCTQLSNLNCSQNNLPN